MTERVLHVMDGLPVLQNRTYDTAEAARACPRGNMRLIEDLRTGLVRNAAFDPARVHYDSAYQNEQGLSTAFRAHLGAVADLIGSLMGQAGLIEIGCGKGMFLELMLARGADITGFDPAYEGDNPRVQRALFEGGRTLGGSGLILRHVLEHIPDPVAFLRVIAAANGGRGLIYIEVPCLDWICAQRSWFDIYYEHVNYFRLSDFRRIFGRVLHAGHGFGGQYLCVVADLATLRDPVRDPHDAPAFPADLMPRMEAQIRASRPPVILWGGASKGVIYALLHERFGRPVDRVIDINPAKQGRYLPATGCRVQSPDEALASVPRGASIIVMNPNYLDEVRTMTANTFDCRTVDA
jgi:hypothetical protein